jgi:shikimate dehydrogenase
MDAVYEPEVTRLLSEAEAQGAQTLSGKWMLIHQAAEQFHLWTRLEAPLEVMSEAFDRAGPDGLSPNLTGPSSS